MIHLSYKRPLKNYIRPKNYLLILLVADNYTLNINSVKHNSLLSSCSLAYLNWLDFLKKVAIVIDRGAKVYYTQSTNLPQMRVIFYKK